MLVTRARDMHTHGRPQLEICLVLQVDGMCRAVYAGAAITCI
jgi:hypothetical protein